MEEKTITFKLSQILNNCYDWDKFCEEQGWSVWAVNEGGGDIEQTLTLKEAKSYGLLRGLLD